MGMLLLAAVRGSGQRDRRHDQEVGRDKGHDTGQGNDRADPFSMQDMVFEDFSDSVPDRSSHGNSLLSSGSPVVFVYSRSSVMEHSVRSAPGRSPHDLCKPALPQALPLSGRKRTEWFPLFVWCFFSVHSISSLR